jgi:hypothetical protein
MLLFLYAENKNTTSSNKMASLSNFALPVSTLATLFGLTIVTGSLSEVCSDCSIVVVLNVS